MDYVYSGKAELARNADFFSERVEGLQNSEFLKKLNRNAEMSSLRLSSFPFCSGETCFGGADKDLGSSDPCSGSCFV